MAKRGRKPGGHNAKVALYTVYDNRDDTLVALDEPATVCARLMGMGLHSFRQTYCKCQKAP